MLILRFLVTDENVAVDKMQKQISSSIKFAQIPGKNKYKKYCKSVFSGQEFH